MSTLTKEMGLELVDVSLSDRTGKREWRDEEEEQHKVRGGRRG